MRIRDERRAQATPAGTATGSRTPSGSRSNASTCAGRTTPKWGRSRVAIGGRLPERQLAARPGLTRPASPDTPWPMGHRSHRARAVVAGAAAICALAGCGSSDSDSASSDPMSVKEISACLGVADVPYQSGGAQLGLLIPVGGGQNAVVAVEDSEADAQQASEDWKSFGATAARDRDRDRRGSRLGRLPGRGRRVAPEQDRALRLRLSLWRLPHGPLTLS